MANCATASFLIFNSLWCNGFIEAATAAAACTIFNFPAAAANSPAVSGSGGGVADNDDKGLNVGGGVGALVGGGVVGLVGGGVVGLVGGGVVGLVGGGVATLVGVAGGVAAASSFSIVFMSS